MAPLSALLQAGQQELINRRIWLRAKPRQGASPQPQPQLLEHDHPDAVALQAPHKVRRLPAACTQASVPQPVSPTDKGKTEQFMAI